MVLLQPHDEGFTTKFTQQSVVVISAERESIPLFLYSFIPEILKNLRITNLQVQRTEGDCLLFKKECISLKKRLHVSERQQNQAAIDMGNNDMQKKHLDVRGNSCRIYWS